MSLNELQAPRWLGNGGGQKGGVPGRWRRRRRSIPTYIFVLLVHRLLVCQYVHMLFDFRFAFYVCDVLLLWVHEYKCCLSVPPLPGPPAPDPLLVVFMCVCVYIAFLYVLECVSLLLCVLVCCLMWLLLLLFGSLVRMNFSLWLRLFHAC